MSSTPRKDQKEGSGFHPLHSRKRKWSSSTPHGNRSGYNPLHRENWKCWHSLHQGRRRKWWALGPLRQQEGSSGRPLQSTGKEKEKKGSGWHPTPVGKRKKVLHGHTLPSAKKTVGKNWQLPQKSHSWNHMIGSTSSRSGLVFTGQRMISITQTETQCFSLRGTFSDRIYQVKMRLDGNIRPLISAESFRTRRDRPITGGFFQGRLENRRVTQNTLGFVNDMGHGHTYRAKATQQQSSFVTQRSPQSKTCTGFGLHKELRTRLHQGTYNSIVGLPLYTASNTISRCARVFKGSGRHSVIVGLLHQPFDHHQRVATFRT